MHSSSRGPRNVPEPSRQTITAVPEPLLCETVHETTPLVTAPPADEPLQPTISTSATTTANAGINARAASSRCGA
jgi:hypothetical protein